MMPSFQSTGEMRSRSMVPGLPGFGRSLHTTPFASVRVPRRSSPLPRRSPRVRLPHPFGGLTALGAGRGREREGKTAHTFRAFELAGDCAAHDPAHGAVALAGEPYKLVPLVAVDEGTDRHPLRTLLLSNLSYLQSLLTYWRICNKISIGVGVQTGPVRSAS
jgi:hypothetical protein